MATKEQTCAYCGDSMGVFEHSNRLDGPLSCGKRECNRYVDDEAAAEREAAHQRADDGEWWAR